MSEVNSTVLPTSNIPLGVIERNLSDLLVACRENRGISQKELSRLSGVAQKTISRIENGLDSPKISTIYKLTEAMGVTFILQIQE